MTSSCALLTACPPSPPMRSDVRRRSRGWKATCRLLTWCTTWTRPLRRSG